MTNWNKSIPMPKDADGREVSLRTKVLYDVNGKKLNIATFNFRCDAQNDKWAYWQVFSPDAKSKDGMCDVDELYLIPPDSWDKLEQDALKNPCKYFGRRDNDDSAWCDGCPAEDGSCFKTKSIDLVRRAKALGTSQARCAASRNERSQELNVITDTKKPFEYIKCPYCDTGKAIKLWFLIGDNRTTADWVDFVTTNPDNGDCLCNVYVCPQCGRIIILDT